MAEITELKGPGVNIPSAVDSSHMTWDSKSNTYAYFAIDINKGGSCDSTLTSAASFGLEFFEPVYARY